MDRFDALQAFVRVVEAGSFTKAAQTLHMSKTARQTPESHDTPGQGYCRGRSLLRTHRESVGRPGGCRCWLVQCASRTERTLACGCCESTCLHIIDPCIASVSCALSRNSDRYGSKRSDGGSDRRQRGLRSTRRRTY